MLDIPTPVKDALAVALVAGSATPMATRVIGANYDLRRAARVALQTAGVTGPLVGGTFFALKKLEGAKAQREEALELTLFTGGIAAAGGLALGGVLSLLWDALTT